MMLLEAKYYSHHGNSIYMTKDFIKGFSWAAIQKCEACGESFHAHGQHKYHSASCKKAIVKARPCSFCGCSFVPNANIGKYCSENCKRWGVPYGSMADRDSMVDRAYELCILQGISRKSAYANMGISNVALRALLEYRCGPDVWQWLEDRQKAISARGFKGHGLCIDYKTGKRLCVSDFMSIRGSKERSDVAKALLVWRKTGSTMAAGVACGRSEVSGSAILLRSKVYSKISMHRRKYLSSWSKKQKQSKRKSVLFKNEKGLVAAVCESLTRGGYEPQREVVIMHQSRQKVDIFLDFMGIRFVIEAKNSGRPNKADECIGQAIRKAANMNGIPVVVFPSDIDITSEVVMGLSDINTAGIELRVCNDDNVCAILAMTSDEWANHVKSDTFAKHWTVAAQEVNERRAEVSASKKESRQCASCRKWFYAYKKSCNRRCSQCIAA